jgi:hypothetical protein
MKETFDILFSLYSNGVILSYIVTLFLNRIDKTFSSKAARYTSINTLVSYSLSAEILYWILSQSKDNQILPDKISNISLLEEIIEKTLTNIEIFLDKKVINKKTLVENLVKDFHIKEVFKHISKNHIPPLVSKNINKNYDIQKKSKKDNSIILSLDNPNSIIFKYPLEAVEYSTYLVTTDSKVYSNIFLRHNISKLKYEKYRKRYTGDSKDFLSKVYALQSCYTYNYASENKNILALKDSKFDKLYQKAIELTGDAVNIKSTKKYYGLFHFIEKDFGSLGSSFDIDNLKEGLYSIRFPRNFGYVVMDNYLDKIFNLLKKKKKFEFLVLIYKYEIMPVAYKDIVDYNEEEDDTDVLVSPIKKKVIEKIENNNYLRRKEYDSKYKMNLYYLIN